MPPIKPDNPAAAASPKVAPASPKEATTSSNISPEPLAHAILDISTAVLRNCCPAVSTVPGVRCTFPKVKNRSCMPSRLLTTRPVRFRANPARCEVASHLPATIILAAPILTRLLANSMPISVSGATWPPLKPWRIGPKNELSEIAPFEEA